MDLLQFTNGCRVVSVLGMAKNTGKTVTLNHLVAQATLAGLPVGLTSIGRDGEKSDILYHTPKPGIFLPRGGMMATAQVSLSRAQAEVEVLENTGIFTPLGEVLIVRARSQGQVELAGPNLVDELRVVCQSLLSSGAQLVIIDGAFDRVAGAAPALADGVILATGAAVDRVMEKVVQRTRERFEQMQLPPPGDDVRELASLAMERGSLTIIEDNEIRPLDTLTALGPGGQLPFSLLQRARAVVASGAAGDRLLESMLEILHRGLNVPLIIKNASCLFVEPALWRRFRSAGGDVRVLEPVRLLAVTVNPTSPGGYNFPAPEFLAAVAEAVRPVPVFNPILQEGICF